MNTSGFVLLVSLSLYMLEIFFNIYFLFNRNRTFKIDPEAGYSNTTWRANGLHCRDGKRILESRPKNYHFSPNLRWYDGNDLKSDELVQLLT